jgi:hypothetical protein
LRLTSLTATLAAIIALAACGSSDDKKVAVTNSSAAVETVAQTTAEPPPTPEAEMVFALDNPSEVRSDHVQVRGEATEGASVRVSSSGHHWRTKASSSGTWKIRVRLNLGDNTLRARATKEGFDEGTDSLVVTRKRSAAERAAVEAARKARQEQARQAFINAAQTIAYKQLNKDADSYEGKKVAYRGQIFQIQQEGSEGGIMLLSVTDDGYGYWSDQIWVDYDHAIGSAEDDVITVYGTVTGSKSFDTQGGGNRYVPQIHARYIVE